MTWEFQWIKMVSKRPRLSDPQALVTISSEQFQSLLSQAYERGVKDARASGARASSGMESDIFGDIFNGMFGRK